jgi:hypothetical protein
VKRLRTKRAISIVSAFAVLGAASIAGVAIADNVQINDVTAGASATKAGGDTGTASVRIVGNNAPNGDINNCNVDATHAATVALSSNQSWLTLSASSLQVTDCGNPGLKTVGYTVDCDAPDGGVATVSTSTSGGLSGALYNDDSFTVTVDGTNSSCGGGGTTNSPPTVSEISGDATANEGDQKTYSVTASDSDNDTLTYAWSVTGNASINGASNGSSVTVDFTDGANPSSTVGIQVVVSDGHVADDVTKNKSVTEFNVAPTLSALSLTGNNGVACIGGNSVGVDFTFSDPAGANDTYTGNIDWGDGSTDGSFSSSPVSTSHSYAAGSYTVAVDVSDEDGGNATQQTGSVSLLYATGNGVLQPINYTGRPTNPAEMSLFKSGSTVPVKIRPTDCNGAPVPGLTLAVQVNKYDNSADGDSVESTSPANPDPGNLMRYDATAGQYIYNLGTKGFTNGDYKITITGATIAPVTAYISLKGK